MFRNIGLTVPTSHCYYIVLDPSFLITVAIRSIYPNNIIAVKYIYVYQIVELIYRLCVFNCIYQNRLYCSEYCQYAETQQWQIWYSILCCNFPNDFLIITHPSSYNRRSRSRTVNCNIIWNQINSGD